MAVWEKYFKKLLAYLVYNNSVEQLFNKSHLKDFWKVKWLWMLLKVIKMVLIANENKWSMNFDERPHRFRTCHRNAGWIHSGAAHSALSPADNIT